MGASVRTPSSIIGPISPPNPPRSANAIGTTMSAVSTDIRFVMISAMKTTIIEKANTVSSGVCTGVGLGESAGLRRAGV